MTTLGVPAAATPEAVAFWTSFWPSFWSNAASGVVTGIVTGLVVGYILLRHQKGIESRSLAVSFGRELSAKLDRLRQALVLQDVINISSARSALPIPVFAALEHLQDAPLSQWENAVPEKKALIGCTIGLQKTAARYTSVAAQVDQLLQQRVRTFNHQRGAISVNDGVYFKYSIGTILGVSGAQLLPWLSSDGPDSIEPYETAWKFIGSDGQLTELAEQLRIARSEAKSMAAALLKEIDV